MSEQNSFEATGSYEDYLKEKQARVERELKKLKDDLALEKSIVKWFKIINGMGADHGSANCELCENQKKVFSFGFCSDCIVHKKTNHYGCNGTPYKDWIIHHEKKHNNPNGDGNERKIVCGECIVLAVRELNFLEGLRPNLFLEAKSGVKRRESYFKTCDFHGSI